MMVAPLEIPVTTPDEVIVAAAVLLLIQPPPLNESVSVVVAPAQTDEAPEIIETYGNALTVKALVANADPQPEVAV